MINSSCHVESRFDLVFEKQPRPSSNWRFDATRNETQQNSSNVSVVFYE